MDVNVVVMSLVAVFICIACIDKLINGRLGLENFIDEGFYTLGPLAMIMIGMITLAPVIARILYPIVSPMLILIKADPSLFVGVVLPSDSGGAPLALSMCQSREAGLFNGVIVASMMGASLGIIPIVLSATCPEKHRYVILGLLVGFMTVPFSALVAGIFARIDREILFYNLVPLTALAIMVASALVYAQPSTIRVMTCIGRIILCIAVFGFAASTLKMLTGVQIIEGMASIDDAFVVLGQIGVVLAGMFPMLHLLKTIFQRQLLQLAVTLKVDDIAIIGILTTLANFFPVIPMLNKMSPKGIIINMAFVVPAGYALGDHLGFTAGFERSFVFPLVMGKIVGGVAAVIVASMYWNYLESHEKGR